MMMQLKHVHDMLLQQGVVAELVGYQQLPIARVHTDTRTLQQGDLFVALRGDNFDGHDYLAKAKAAGAIAVIAEEGIEEAGCSGVIVPDTRKALGALSAAWRKQFEIPLVAVTGSNGKTTVTQMLASILHAWHGDHSWATKGNFNNDIGVPLTLLGLRQQHASAVVELGMNHPGEIAVLADYAQPTVAIVNNAQREHQEFMHTVDAVAQENGAVIRALPANGVAVFPADSEYTDAWRSIAGDRGCMTFGIAPHGGSLSGADVTAKTEWMNGAWQMVVDVAGLSQPIRTELHVAGSHNVRNALAAIAAAVAAGAPAQAIAQGVQQFRPVKGRSLMMQLDLPQWRVALIDDTYNANPDSMNAAVDVLAELPGPHLLVLGDMGEVGADGEDLHAELGEYAMHKGIESLYCTGDLMRYCAAAFPDARHFGSMSALQKKCVAEMHSYRSILVKGSRFMRMEQVVQALADAAGSKAQDVPSGESGAVANTQDMNGKAESSVEALTKQDPEQDQNHKQKGKQSDWLSGVTPRSSTQSVQHALEKTAENATASVSAMVAGAATSVLTVAARGAAIRGGV